MMNVLISIGNRVTDVLPDDCRVLLDTFFKGCWWLVAAVVQGRREDSDAHWLAPKVVSTAEVMV